MKKIILIFSLILSVFLIGEELTNDQKTTVVNEKPNVAIEQTETNTTVVIEVPKKDVVTTLESINLLAKNDESLLYGNTSPNGEVEVVMLVGSTRIVTNVVADENGLYRVSPSDLQSQLKDGIYEIVVSLLGTDGEKQGTISRKNIKKDTTIDAMIVFDDADGYLNSSELVKIKVKGAIESDSTISSLKLIEKASQKEHLIDTTNITMNKEFEFEIKSKELMMERLADGEIVLELVVRDDVNNTITKKATIVKLTQTPDEPKVLKSIKNGNILNAQVQNSLVFFGEGTIGNSVSVKLYNKKDPKIVTQTTVVVDDLSHWTVIGRDLETKKLPLGDIVAEIIQIDKASNKSKNLVLEFKKEPNPIFPLVPEIIPPEEYMTVHTMKEVGDVIKSIVINDEFLIASTYEYLFYFDKRKGEVKKKIQLKKQWINSLVLYKDMILLALDDGSVQIRDMKTSTLRATLKGEKFPILEMKIDGDTLITSATDGSIVLWDLLENKQITKIRKHQWDVGAIAVGDGKIFTGSDDYSIKIWDMSNGKYIKNLKSAHKGTINALLVYKNLLISASDDKTIHIRDIETNKLIKVLNEHKNGVTALAISRDTLVSTSNDRTVILWDLKSYQKQRQLRGHSKSIVSLAINDENIVTGSLDYTMRVWGLDQTIDKTGDIDESLLAKYDLVKSIEGSKDPITALASTQNEIIFGTFGGIYFYNNVTYLPTKRYSTLDQVRVNLKQDDKEIKEDGKEKESKKGFGFDNEESPLTFDEVIEKKKKELDDNASLSPQWVNTLYLQGNRLFAGLGHKHIKIWDIESNKAIQEVEGHEAGIHTIIRNDDKFISASADGVIKIWAQEKMDLLMSIDAHQWNIRTLVSDGDKLYSGSDDYGIKVWDIETGDMIEDIKSAHEEKITALGIYKNSLLSGGKDGKIIARDKESFVVTKQITLGGAISSFTIDENVILCGLDNGDIEVYNLDSFALLKIIKKAHLDGVNAIMTVNDYIISGGNDKKINIWKYYE